MKTVTIQKTSKPLKLASVLSIFAFIGGLLLMKASPVLAFLLLIGGMSSYLVTKILVWWHHK